MNLDHTKTYDNSQKPLKFLVKRKTKMSRSDISILRIRTTFIFHFKTSKNFNQTPKKSKGYALYVAHSHGLLISKLFLDDLICLFISTAPTLISPSIKFPILSHCFKIVQIKSNPYESHPLFGSTIAN